MLSFFSSSSFLLSWPQRPLEGAFYTPVYLSPTWGSDIFPNHHAKLNKTISQFFSIHLIYFTPWIDNGRRGGRQAENPTRRARCRPSPSRCSCRVSGLPETELGGVDGDIVSENSVLRNNEISSLTPDVPPRNFDFLWKNLDVPAKNSELLSVPRLPKVPVKNRDFLSKNLDVPSESNDFLSKNPIIVLKNFDFSPRISMSHRRISIFYSRSHASRQHLLSKNRDVPSRNPGDLKNKIVFHLVSEWPMLKRTRGWYQERNGPINIQKTLQHPVPLPFFH